MTHPFLWVPFTLAAALMQVLRNAFQARLGKRIGTLGGTQVRFVFGLPFAAVLLAGDVLFDPQAFPPITLAAMGWGLLGAVSQIVATFLMLIVMRREDFGVAYAYIKTEPVTVALLGLVLIGDRLPALSWVAVIVVTFGVILASLRRGNGPEEVFDWRPVLIGVAGGALFGLSAIAFRASIHALPQGDFVLRSLTMLVISLAMQSAILGAWFVLRDGEPFLASLREWRLTVAAGLLGALASACWFMGFALTAAANVRTLSLVEMPIVALASRYVSGRWLSGREWAGFLLVTFGVTLLLFSHAG